MIPVGAVVAVIVIVVLLGLIAAARSFKVVQQYEKGIIYRFGRVLPEIRGPGLALIRPVGDRMQKVNMQIVAMAVPAQEGITRDNVSVRVDAVVYFRSSTSRPKARGASGSSGSRSRTCRCRRA